MTDREFILWLMGLLDAPLSPGGVAELLDRIRARLVDVRPSVPAAFQPPHAGPAAAVSGPEELTIYLRDFAHSLRAAAVGGPEELPSSCPRGTSSGVLDNEAALTDWVSDVSE